MLTSAYQYFFVMHHRALLFMQINVGPSYGTTSIFEELSMAHTHHNHYIAFAIASFFWLWLHYTAIEPIGCATCMLKEAREVCDDVADKDNRQRRLIRRSDAEQLPK